MTRNHALDSLRGLAALAVALGHSNLALTGLDAWQATIFDLPHLGAGQIAARLLYLVFPQDAAVTLFFVLSGHVLWGSFERTRTTLAGGRDVFRFAFDFLDYILSRSYRLLPTLMAACLIVAILSQASVSVLATNMVLLDHDLIGVSWSLQVELICSLALFVAHRLVRGSAKGTLGLLLVIVGLAGSFKGSNFFLFFPAFLLGALIDALPSWLWRRGTAMAGLMLLSAGSLVLGRHAPGRAAEMLGSVALIGWVGAHHPRFLLTPTLLFLGAISYPFYLVHPFGMRIAEPIVAESASYGVVPCFVAFAVVSIGLAIPIATLFHVGVERPLMQARPRLRRRTAELPSRPSPVEPVQAHEAAADRAR